MVHCMRIRIIEHLSRLPKYYDLVLGAFLRVAALGIPSDVLGLRHVLGVPVLAHECT